MDGENLLANFETLAEAPGGVGRMRELILQLAVQGKLVPQAPDDEPATVLLTRAKSIGAALVERGEAKKAQSVSPESRNAAPYKLPSGWSWASMEDLTSKLGAGSTPLGGKETYVASGVKFLRSQNVWNDGLRLDHVAFIDGGTHDRMSGTCVRPKDVLLNITGASIGRSAIVPDDFDEGNVSQHVAIVRPVIEELRGYLHTFLISPLAQGRIMDVQVGISREGLSMDRLRRFPVPLPPLAEQRRIVAKVDELMALCDELEARQKQRHTVCRSLQTSALEALSSADNPDALAEAWNRVRANWDALTARPDSIRPLRQAILQLAVQGKLTHQDFADEPADRLLAQIAEEKERNTRGRRKKSTKQPVTDELTFEVPATWLKVRAGDLFSFATSGSRGWAEYYAPKGAVFLRIGNLDYGTTRLDLTSLQHVLPPDGVEGTRTKVEPGDLLISITGDTGMVGIVPDGFGDGYINQHLALARPVRRECAEFLSIAFTAPSTLSQLWGAQRGVKNSLGLDDICNVVVPLAPINEQRRIVAKVDQLMALCDELETKLQTELETSARFASASARSVTV